MPENNLKVRIVASDEATAVLEKFQKRIGGVEAPTKRFAKTTEQVAKSTRGWRQLGQAGSFDAIGKGMRTIGHEAHSAFRSVGRLSVGLGSLAEVGEIGMGAIGAGGLAGIGAATIGVMALTKSWADHGVALSNSSMAMDMGADQLYRYQRAAALTGVSADTVTSSLGGLYNALSSSKINPTVANALRVIGVNAQDAHGKLLPMTQLFPKIADAIDKMPNPYAQANAMQALGIDPSMLPFLRQGGAAITKEMNLLKSQGVGDNFGGSQKLYADWQTLDTAIGNTSDIFAKKLAPAADGVVHALTGFFNWLPHMNDATPTPDQNDPAGRYVKQGDRLIWQSSGYVPGPSGYYTKQGARQIFHKSARGIIDNNPLNLHYAGQDGTVGQDGKNAVFKNMQLGVTAAANQLLRDTTPKSAGGHGLTTLASLISDPTYGWAPASDGNNDPAYIADVAQRTGIKPNAPLNLNDPKVLESLLNAQAIHETGQPIDTGLLNNAADSALGLPNAPAGGGVVTVNVNHNNAPPGTSISTTTSGSGVTVGGVHISRAMTGSGV
jgi:hypothetical protein